jgi:hypothetical protein
VLPDDKLVVWAFVNRYSGSKLPQAAVEKAAREAHEFYRQRRWEKGETSDNSLKPWDALCDSLKESNRDQISFMENVLRKSAFEVVPSPTPHVIRFTSKELDEMAEREHARFVMERLSEGWVYGEPKDVEKKISPYLVPWAEVPELVKRYDTDAVALFPALLAKLGYEIQRPETK